MRHLPIALILFALISLPRVATAVEIQINQRDPFVYIQIGHGDLNRSGLFGPPSSLVDEVSFAFPIGVRPGDGTPIAGTPTIPIALLGLSVGGNAANFRVTMDSSAGLLNGSGDLLLFSEISWTTTDGDIPSGQFDDSGNQLLMEYQFAPINNDKGRGVIDYLTFSYANDRIYPAGTYTGRVVYTITEL